MSVSADLGRVRAIAKSAYIYGFPMVDSYRVQYAYFIDSANPEYKGPWNEVHSTARVFTPADTAVQTPNSDTPYSMLGADLRAEPLVLTVPPVEEGRYYSLQFIDGLTYNFAYVGSRTTGNGGGSYLLAGPNWTGDKPAGVAEVIRCETDFALVVYRTQLMGPDDLGNVESIQAGYRCEPLSALLNEAAEGAVAIAWPAPLTPDEQKTSVRFFDLLDFQLGYAPATAAEEGLRAEFASIGLTGKGDFDSSRLSPDLADAFRAGMADAWAEFTTLKTDKIDSGAVTAGDLFGTRAQLNGNDLYRMAGAVLGIYGNSEQEAMYPVLSMDADGAPLTGACAYTLTFPPDSLPPVSAFWSVTMYRLPESLLVDNPINRYLINSPMLPDMVRDPDGGVTINVQCDPPDAQRTHNWLPAPDGPFTIFLRLYWPKPEALDGRWKPPGLVRTR